MADLLTKAVVAALAWLGVRGGAGNEWPERSGRRPMWTVHVSSSSGMRRGDMTGNVTARRRPGCMCAACNVSSRP